MRRWRRSTLRYALENARINLQYSRILAPISGQTDLSVVLPGSLVTAHQAQALTTISPLDPMYVDITQSSSELLELRRQWQAGAFGKVEASGAQVRLALEDGSAYPHAGKLQFIPVVTREQHPGALNGRITALIENGELERAAGLALSPEHSRVMICGNPQMIDDTRALLKQRDLQLSLTRRPGQVAVENYW